MKNIISILLAMLMMLSFASCSDHQADPVGKIDEDESQSSQSDSMSDQSETPDRSSDSQSDEQTPVVYTLETVPAPKMTGRDFNKEVYSDAIEYCSRYGIENDCGVSELETYLEQLRIAGFTFKVSQFDQTDKQYLYSSTAKNGNAIVTIEFEWYEFDESKYDANEGTPTETAIFYVSIYIEDVVKSDFSGESAETLLPKLLDGEWRSSEGESYNTIWTHYYKSNLDLETVKNYVEQLKNEGYNINIEEAPNGNEDANLYAFEAVNQAGVKVEVHVVSEEDFTNTTISIGIPK